MSGNAERGERALEKEHKRCFQQALLSFVDFLYAIVFASLLDKSYEHVIKDKTPTAELLVHLLLLLHVFYFLCWDWLVGRMLTLRIPYESFTRFFLELFIATLAFGTAASAVYSKAIFFLFLSLFLFAGVLWAHHTRRQLERRNAKDQYMSPNRDFMELCATKSVQYVAAAMFAAVYGIHLCQGVDRIAAPVKITSCLLLWIIVLIYEFSTRRPRGLLAGPGVPFISRATMIKWRYRVKMVGRKKDLRIL